MTNTETTPTTATKIHPFEVRKLGLAPFRCIAVIEKVYQAIPGDPSCPIQPGGCCDYCGQGIRYCAVIKSADGKRFEVGTDCAARVGDECATTDFEREFSRIAAKIRSEMRKLEHARADKRIARALACFEAHRDLFDIMTDEDDIERAKKLGREPRSLANKLEFLMSNRTGRAGKIKACRLIEGAAKNNNWTM